MHSLFNQHFKMIIIVLFSALSLVMFDKCQSSLFEACTPCSCPSVFTIECEIMNWNLPNTTLFIDLNYHQEIQLKSVINHLSKIALSENSINEMTQWLPNELSTETRNDTTAITTKKLNINNIPVCGTVTWNITNDPEDRRILVSNMDNDAQNQTRSFRHLGVVFRTHRFAKVNRLCDVREFRGYSYVPRFFLHKHDDDLIEQHSMWTLSNLERGVVYTCAATNTLSMNMIICDNCKLNVTYGKFQFESLCANFITYFIVNPSENASANGPVLLVSGAALQTLPSSLQNQFERIEVVSDNTFILESSLLCSCNGSSNRVPAQITFPNLQGCGHSSQMVPSDGCTSYVKVYLIVSSALVVLSVLCAVLIYKCRWRIKYVCHLVRKTNRRHDIEVEDDFEYDAFLAYADDDREFVIKDMRLKLEEEFGLSLCIHHRDFIPGQPIADNITEAIEKSKKVIVVLSPYFLQSYWCTYEVQMAKYAGIRRGRNMIIVVVYRQVKVRDVTKELRDLMKIDSFSTFPDDPLGQKVFWGNMKKAIQK